MRKFISCFLISLVLFSIYAQPKEDEIRIIARIKASGHKVKIKSGEKTSSIKIKLSSSELFKTIKNLEPGDEALISGHFDYEIRGVEEKISTPLFVIHSIKPISLKRLGKINQRINEKSIMEEREIILGSEEVLGPKTIPVTSEVANAITMTLGLLMLEDLSASENDPKMRRDLNQGLIFSAGALATGLFIYEQINKMKNSR
jgi:hypothetical protein